MPNLVSIICPSLKPLDIERNSVGYIFDFWIFGQIPYKQKLSKLQSQ